MYTTNFSLVGMMIDMLNQLSNSFNFVKQRLDELEHPDLITEWIHNMKKDAYL